MKLGAIVLDSDNIEELSDFYAKMLGWNKSSQVHNGEKWITVIKDDYTETPLFFQGNHNYKKPIWPSTVSILDWLILFPAAAFAFFGFRGEQAG